MFSNTYKTVTIFTGLLLLIIFKGYSYTAPLDSIGIQKDGNKTFILHKVDPKETLFSLAKRYNVKVALIESENPDLKEGVKIGQVLRIPYFQKTTTTSPAAQGNTKTHIVGQGQTLYSISRIYKVSVDNIKKWNNLNSNEVNVGQEILVSEPPQVKINQEEVLQENHPEKQETSPVPHFKYDPKGNKVHITEPGQTLFSIAQIYNISVDDLKAWNTLSNNEISTGQEIIVEKGKEKEVAQVKEKPVDVPVKPTQHTNTTPKSDSGKLKEYAPINIKPSTNSDFNKIIERGLAESIEESGDNPKFLALHKTASVGTIIQIKNELNNLYIFARVIGRLPNTGSNDKLVVKLSKKAYDKLGAVDKRFPVEVSYVPQ